MTIFLVYTDTNILNGYAQAFNYRFQFYNNILNSFYDDFSQKLIFKLSFILKYKLLNGTFLTKFTIRFKKNY